MCVYTCADGTRVPVCTGACGGWRVSSVFSHVSLFLTCIVFITGVCERERDGSGDQKASFEGHFFPPTVGIELTQVIRLGWQAPLPAEHLEGPLPYLLRSLLTLGLTDLERLPCY